MNKPQNYDNLIIWVLKEKEKRDSESFEWTVAQKAIEMEKA